MPEPWLLVGARAFRNGDEVELDEEEARHASGALRCRVGNPVILANGLGAVARAKLLVCKRSRAVAEVVHAEQMAPPLGGVTIAMAVLHTKAMDWAVQKAVEVGAEALTPLICRRTQMSVDAAVGRVGHWRRVARQALKQCRRAWAMEVHDPVDVQDLMHDRRGPGVVADPEGESPLDLPPEFCRWLVVGPEGGLTSDERDLLEGAGWRRADLGPHILRAETAAVVGAALLGMRIRGAGAP